MDPPPKDPILWTDPAPLLQQVLPSSSFWNLSVAIWTSLMQRIQTLINMVKLGEKRVWFISARPFHRQTSRSYNFLYDLIKQHLKLKQTVFVFISTSVNCGKGAVVIVWVPKDESRIMWQSGRAQRRALPRLPTLVMRGQNSPPERERHVRSFQSRDVFLCQQ